MNTRWPTNNERRTTLNSGVIDSWAAGIKPIREWVTRMQADHDHAPGEAQLPCPALAYNTLPFEEAKKKRLPKRTEPHCKNPATIFLNPNIHSYVSLWPHDTTKRRSESLTPEASCIVPK